MFAWVVFFVMILAHSAHGFEAREGCFVAAEACPAFASFRKETNPGDVALTAGESYALRGVNRARDPDWAQILVPGAEPRQRWASMACGVARERCESDRASEPAERPAEEDSADRPSHARNLLAVNWQPAFCETRPHVAECRSQTEERFDADHFALHGLWPQPRDEVYCDASAEQRRLDAEGRWDLLAPVELTSDTRRELERAMPGAQSFLERHEWVKHGLCYSASAEEYYAESLHLLEQLNASDVRRLFVLAIGEEIGVEEVRAAFDRSFGPRAGDRVRMRCVEDGRRRLISELWIELAGEITEDSALGDLLLAAEPARGSRDDCRFGEVDAVHSDR